MTDYRKILRDQATNGCNSRDSKYSSEKEDKTVKSVMKVLAVIVVMSFLVGMLTNCGATPPAAEMVEATPTKAVEEPAAEEPDAEEPAPDEAESFADTWTGPTIDKYREAGKIRAGFAIEAPFVIQDPKTGEQVGVFPDALDELEERLGIPIEIVQSDWSVLVADLQAGKIDVIAAPLNWTEERAKVVDFVDPFYFTGWGYVIRRDNAKIESIDDLNSEDVTIATLTGTAGEQGSREDFPKAKIRSVLVPGGWAVEEIVSGRADVTPLTNTLLKAWLASYDDILTYIPEDAITNPIRPTGTGWAVRQGEEDWLNCLNAFVADVIAEGMVDDWMEKYSTPDYMEPPQTE